MQPKLAKQENWLVFCALTLHKVNNRINLLLDKSESITCESSELLKIEKYFDCMSIMY